MPESALPAEAQSLFDGLGEAVGYDLTDAWKVPQSVIDALPLDKKSGKPSTRGLGRSIQSRTQGKRAIRTVDGVVYALSTEHNPQCISKKFRK